MQTDSVEGARAATLDAATQVGVVSLAVANLSRSLTYYHEALGMTVLEQRENRAVLGAGSRPILMVTEEAGARPWPHDRQSFTGLYHFAVLVPTRADLGRWLRHWLEIGGPVPGQGDHLVSEALYLSDPDGNGIEIYRDRPRGEWQWVNGRVRMATDPVDMRGLLDEAERTTEPWAGMADGTRLGHMHLQVSDIPQSEAFYHAVLGFDVVAAMPSALFVSAGGYHHHVGMNIWHSHGAAAAPEGYAGLRFYTIEAPSEEARAQMVKRIEAAGVEIGHHSDAITLRDPSGDAILLTVGTPDAAHVAALAEGMR